MDEERIDDLLNSCNERVKRLDETCDSIEKDVDLKEVENGIFNKSYDLLNQLHSASSEALAEVKCSPSDMEIINAATALIAGYTKLADSVSRLINVQKKLDNDIKKTEMKNASSTNSSNQSKLNNQDMKEVNEVINKFYTRDEVYKTMN